MRFMLALILSLFPGLSAAQTIDYNIANQAFAPFRTDLNNHLSAIVQHNAGTVAPTTTFPYMVWADTSGATPVFRYRNAANAAWTTGFRIDPSATVWLGNVETASATITGGTINGTAVGQVNPAAGTFSALTANAPIRSASGTPGVFMRETGTATTHNGTWIVQDGNNLSFQTRNNSDVLVSTDYIMTKGAGGATSHRWIIGTVDVLRLENIGVARMLNAYPMSDAGGTLGDGGNRWLSLFLVNSPNVSSDARLKNSVEDVAEAECRVADRIKIRRYRLNADPDGPWHFGAIAQEVIAAFAAEGLDWQNYAIVTGSEADGYGVAYDELQNLKLACM